MVQELLFRRKTGFGLQGQFQTAGEITAQIEVIHAADNGPDCVAVLETQSVHSQKPEQEHCSGPDEDPCFFQLFLPTAAKPDLSV